MEDNMNRFFELVSYGQTLIESATPNKSKKYGKAAAIGAGAGAGVGATGGAYIGHKTHQMFGVLSKHPGYKALVKKHAITLAKGNKGKNMAILAAGGAIPGAILGTGAGLGANAIRRAVKESTFSNTEYYKTKHGPEKAHRFKSRGYGMAKLGLFGPIGMLTDGGGYHSNKLKLERFKKEGAKKISKDQYTKLKKG
jgi:hypothetical protein